MPDISDTFSQLLSSELQLTRSLHQLLKQESEALSQAELEPLPALQQQKKTLLKQLQHQSQQRLSWMTEQQLPHSAACIERPEFATRDDIISTWQQLADSYERNQRLSEVLSELVLAARKRTLDQLNILRGKQNDPHLYNATGKTSGLNQGSGYTQA